LIKNSNSDISSDKFRLISAFRQTELFLPTTVSQSIYRNRILISVSPIILDNQQISDVSDICFVTKKRLALCPDKIYLIVTQT